MRKRQDLSVSDVALFFFSNLIVITGQCLGFGLCLLIGAQTKSIITTISDALFQFDNTGVLGIFLTNCPDPS